MASVELLKAARAKIADPKNWTQGVGARDANGRKIACDSQHAVCWCAYGALWAFVDFINTEEEVLLEDAAERIFGTYPSVVNDNYGHGAVLKIYDEAIAKAEASNA